MATKKIKLSVAIPAYKEERNIRAGALEKVYEYLSKQKYGWEVIITDDASPDKTVELAEAFCRTHKGFRVSREPHRGKGGNVLAGLRQARGEIAIFIDMDQATPVEEIAKVLPCFDEGYDVVIGSRKDRKGAGFVRKVMAFGFVVLRRLILNMPIKDTQCGFKAMNQKAIKILMPALSDYLREDESRRVTAAFDLELLFVAQKKGLRIKEVPVAWQHRASERVNPIKDSIDGLSGMLKIRRNALQGKYR